MKRRALFVDDDADVLEGLENRLRRMRKRWRMSFVGSAQAALDHLEHHAVDVIVTDMRMPGANGADLLTEVRSRYPQVIRVVLTGEAGVEGARLMKVAHQVLSKPCDSDHLERLLEQTTASRGLVHDEDARALVLGLGRLPALPRIHQAITGALERPDASLADVAALIEEDPAITAHLLQLANSAFVGVGRTLTRLAEAVSFLGADLVQSLVLSMELLQALSGGRPTPEQVQTLLALQSHSVAVAKLAVDLAPASLPRSTIYTAAVLHDVGELVLAVGAPKLVAAAEARAELDDVPFHLGERREHGFGHPEVGAFLLSLWGLADPIVEVAASHHRPGEAAPEHRQLVVAVHAADALTHEDPKVLLDPTWFEAHDPSTLARWHDRATALAPRESRRP